MFSAAYVSPKTDLIPYRDLAPLPESLEVETIGDVVRLVAHIFSTQRSDCMIARSEKPVEGDRTQE